MATIRDTAGIELRGAFQEELAETCGLTSTLIVDFLENGKELTFPDYLGTVMWRYIGDLCGFFFPLLERRCIAETTVFPLQNQISHSHNRYKAG